MKQFDVPFETAAPVYLRNGRDLEKAKAILAKGNVLVLTEADSMNITKLQEQCAVPVPRQRLLQLYINNGRNFDKTKTFMQQQMDELMAQVEAAQAASQTPTVAAPGPASPLAAAGAVALPRAQAEKEHQKQEQTTVLTITPDMLLGDDSEDEELTDGQGPGMDQVD